MSELFQEQLQALRARSLHRKLREIGSAQGSQVRVIGQQLINFSSNDYLGLANHPRLREAATAAIAEFGVGAGASRLISGTQSPHVRLETALARWKGTPAALCFSSGYAAAVGTIPALVGKNDVVLLDKLSHASLIDGARLSGAMLRVFPHNHLGKLESHLNWAHRERAESRVLIVTESVFSMDGDLAPLRELIELKNRFRAILFLDEAHAVGVLGTNGRGLAAEENLSRKVEIQMGTLSKALGVSGGYICGSRALIDWLINRARSFIYSTAPPPATAAAAEAAVELLASPEGEELRLKLGERIATLQKFLPPPATAAAAEAAVELLASPEGEEQRLKLAERIAKLKKFLPKLATTGEQKDHDGRPGLRSAITPWIIGDEQAAVDLARSLQAQGFLVPAIRYPTVAKGSARLRITVTAAHEEAQIRALCEALSHV